MQLSPFTREDTRPAAPQPARLIAGRFPALPANLQHHAAERRFVCWRYASKKNGRGKYAKIPFNPIKLITNDKPRGTYLAAEMDNPATWGTFTEVCTALRDWPTWFAGWGIVLLPVETGIDLDDVVANGETHPYAAAIVESFEGRAYIETSISGTGIHIIALGRCDEARKTDAIEVYPGGTGRYFTVSGLELPGSARPCDAQDAIDRVSRRLKRSGKRAPAEGNTGCGTAPPDAAIAEARQRLPELWKSLHNNATSQLIDLVKYGRFPAGMGTTASDARSVVVAQLLRAPNRAYTDAEIVVLALRLWHIRGYEGQMEGNAARLQRDALRLIEKYRPRGRQVIVKPKPPADKRQTQAGEVDRFYAFLQERISGPSSFKTADLAADYGISRRSAITYLDRLVVDGRIHIDRKRGRNGGMVIRFGPAENVQAFVADEAPVCAAPMPESEPSADVAYNTGLECSTTPQTRVPNAREGCAHISPPADHSSQAELITWWEAQPPVPTADWGSPAERQALADELLAAGNVGAAWWIAPTLGQAQPQPPTLAELAKHYLDQRPDAIGECYLRTVEQPLMDIETGEIFVRRPAQVCYRRTAKHFAHLVELNYPAYTRDAALAAYAAEKDRRAAEAKAEWKRYFHRLDMMPNDELIAYISGRCRTEVYELAREGQPFDKHLYQTRLKCAKRELSRRGVAMPTKRTKAQQAAAEAAAEAARARQQLKTRQRPIACAPVRYEQPQDDAPAGPNRNLVDQLARMSDAELRAWMASHAAPATQRQQVGSNEHTRQ